jgi:hypothetical protein
MDYSGESLGVPLCFVLSSVFQADLPLVVHDPTLSMTCLGAAVIYY